MPKLTASKEDIKGQPPMPEGLYTVVLKGFNPRLSKKKDSINLNPDLVIINHPEHNDRKVWESLNTKAKWTWKDFCAGFGVVCVEDANGGIEFPGNFNCSVHGEACTGIDPEHWTYVGPLLGQRAQVYLVQVQVVDQDGKPSVDKRGNTHTNQTKYYVSALGQSASA